MRLWYNTRPPKSSREAKKMKTYTLKKDNATLLFKVREGDYGEYTGESIMEFDKVSEEALEEWMLEAYTISGEAHRYLILDDDSTDTYIARITALLTYDCEFIITVDCKSAFWLFHDIHHALKDFSSCSAEKVVYMPPLEVTSEDELNAHEFAIKKVSCRKGLT